MADYDSLSAQFQLGGLKTRTTDASLLGGWGGGGWGGLEASSPRKYFQIFKAQKWYFQPSQCDISLK